MKLSNLLKNITNRLSSTWKKTLILGVVGWVCSGVVFGGNYLWKDSVSTGNWSDTNWKYSAWGIGFTDSNKIPGNGDVVYIENTAGNTVTITLTADISTNELHIDSNNNGGTVIIDTNGFTLNVNNLYVGKKNSTTTGGDIELKIEGSGSVIASSIQAATSNSGKTNTINLGADAKLIGTIPATITKAGNAANFLASGTVSTWGGSPAQWDITPTAATKKIVFQENHTVTNPAFFTPLTALESIIINNDSTLDLGAIDFNIDKIATNSEGTIKTSGNITLTSAYTSETLKIEAGTVNHTNYGQFDLTCYSISASAVNIRDNGGRKSINTFHTSNFGNVTFSGGSLSCGIDCKEDYTINDLTISKTGGTAIIWGGGYQNTNTATATINGTVTGTGSYNVLQIYCPVIFTSSQNFTGINIINAQVIAAQNPGSSVSITLNGQTDFPCAMDITSIIAKSDLTFSGTGTVKIKSLEMNGVNGTLTVNKDISISDQLLLKGSSSVLPLSISSTNSSSITITKDYFSGQYLNVNTGTAPSITGGLFHASDSTSDDLPSILSKGWIFIGADDCYWTGKTDSDWEKTDNWLPEAVPGSTKNVYIRSNRSIYPEIATTAASVKTLTMEADTTLAATAGLTIDTALVLDKSNISISGIITDNNSITISEPLTITGDTVFITDSITVSADINGGSDYILQFYPSTATKSIYLGSDSASNFSINASEISKLYGKKIIFGENTYNTHNIIINGNFTADSPTELLTKGSVTASGDFSITPGTNSLILNAVSGIGSSTNSVKINNSTPVTLGGASGNLFATNTTGDIYLETNENLTIADNLSTSGTICLNTAGNITKSAGTLTAATVILNSATGIGTSATPVTASASSIELSASTSGNIYFSNDAAASYNVTATSGSISITNNGTLTVATGNSISAANNDVTLKASGFSFTDTPSVSAGTGTLTITADSASRAISLKDSDIGKLSVTGSFIFGDSAHTGTVGLTQDTPPATVILPANTTINGSTFSQSADINTNSKVLTINGNITITSGTLTGSSGDITITGDWTNNATFTPASSTVYFAGTSEIKGTSTTTFNNLTIKTNSSLTCAGDFNIAGDWTNNGTFTGTGSTVHFAGVSEIKGSSVTTFNNLTIDSGKALKSSVSATEGNIIKLSGDWTNNAGTAGFDANNGTVQLTDSSSISGETIFNNFTAENLGNKTITLNSDVTVNGTLSLKGTDATHLLTIADNQTVNSNGKGFILSASQPSDISGTAAGDYLKIDTTVKIKKADGSSDGITGFFYKASNSVPAGTFSADAAGVAAKNAAYATAINNGWRIKELAELTYTWDGGAASTATDWETRTHWDIGIVPGVTTTGQTQSSGATVIIPDGKTSYPQLETTAYKLSSLTIGTSGAATHNAKLTLNGSADLSVVTNAIPAADGTLANYSQIIYSSSGRIKGAAAVINDSTSGSVEYNTATGTISDVTYYDLKITGGNWTNTSGKAVTVNNTITVENAPIINLNNGLSCTASSLTIPAGTDLTLGGTINSGSNTQTYNCPVKLSADTTFNSPVKTGEADLTFTGNNHKFSFVSTLTGTPTPAPSTTYYNITIDGKAEFSGNISNFKTLILTKDAEIKTANLNIAVPVEINDDITISGAAVVFKNDISGTDKQLTLTTTASFSGASEITANILNKGTINVPAVPAAGTPAVPQVAVSFKGTYTANDSLQPGTLAGSTAENPYIDFYKDAVFGNFTANNDTVRFVGTETKNFNPNNQTFKTIIFDKGTTTISEDFTTDNLTINTNGIVVATDNKTLNVNYDWTNAAGTTGFDAKKSTVEFLSTGNSNISGNTTFYNLKCITEDKTLIFEGNSTQTISNLLTLTGKENHLITLKSSAARTPSPVQWKIECTKENTEVVPSHSISYVDVQDSNNLSVYRLKADHSTDSENNTRWNFVTETYTWTGASDPANSNWFDQENWDQKSVPGIGVDVIIAVVASGKKYPVLEHNLENVHSAYSSIGSTGTITVNSGAQLDLSTYELTAGKITNNGRIRLSGGNNVLGPANGKPDFDNKTDSIVEYYGSLRSDKKAAMGTSYANLEFTTGPGPTPAGTSGEISDAITVNQTTLIANSTGKTLTLSGDNTFTGVVTIGQATPAITGGTITINAVSDLTIADGTQCDSLNATVTEGDSGKTITLQGSLTTTLATGSASFTGKTIITAGGASGSPVAITVPGGLTINGNYINQGFINNNALTQINGSFINNSGKDYTAGENTSFTVNFTDSGTYTSTKKIIFNGTGAQNFTSNTASTYADIFINKTAGSSEFTNDVNITKLTDTATAGSITFTGNTVFANDVTFLTTGTVQFGSSAASVTTLGLAAPYTKLKHVSGPSTLYGRLIAAEADFASVSCGTDLLLDVNQVNLYGSVTTAASFIKLNGDLTTGNAITIAPDIMLNGSFNGDGQAVASNNLYVFAPAASPAPVAIETVTVTGNLIFNRAGTINTKGSIKAGNIVLYAGNLIANADSVLEAVNDLVLLGANYNISNTESGNPQEFIYQQTRLSSVHYLRANFNATDTAEDKMADGTLLPTSTAGFSGTYTAGNGAMLKAGKNFYANGTSFTAASTWFINLPDITNTNNGFAETLYTSTVFSTIRCNADSSTDGSKARMPAYFCTDNGNNQNWLFDDFEISEAHTERDNVIKLTFNRAARNLNSELINSISRFMNDTDTYSGFYTDPDCQNPLTSVNIPTGSIYIKSENSWNTDATGKTSGTEISTDRSGVHKNVIPYIQIKALTENSSVHISDVWGKRLKNYDGNNRFVDITDKTGPVLYSVRTGQEFHTPYDSSKGPSSQPSFDGHNFLEFRYSEKVNFGDTDLATDENVNKAVFDNADLTKSLWLPAAAVKITEDFPEIDNVRVKDSFGVLTNDITANGAINITGLGTIASGLMHTGSSGKTDRYVNAFYRIDEYSIRLSVAGYTAGTVTDRNGNTYKNWVGYIEQAIQPAGAVTMTDSVNRKVTDCALELDETTPVYNPQEKYADNQVIPVVNQIYSTKENYTLQTIYSNWDISAPVFTPLRLDPESEWKPDEYYEAVGNTSGMGSTLDKIEFHLFDNTPAYSSSDEAAWLTEKGWIKNSTDKNYTLYDENYSYAADIIGGARQFNADDTQRTTGGIRYSSINSAAGAFLYIDSQVKSAVPNRPFDTSENGVFIGAKASLFTGSSNLRRSADAVDGLYFGLKLTDSDLPVSRSFTVSYDDTKGYITDLAGNRLRSATFKTIDRTPPSFDLLLSPINQNELYMVFVKKLITASDTIKYRDSKGFQIPISENFETLIPKCFELFSLDSKGKAVVSESLQIDYSVPARIEEIVSKANEQEFTVIRLKLTGNTTLPAIENMYVRLKYADGYEEFSQDPITSINDSRVTFIQDTFGNYMPMYQAHTLSDFAVSSINPLYAYDADMMYNDEIIMNNFYGEGTWAVHDWNEEQQNYGTLPANHPYAIVSDTITGTNKTEDLPAGVRIFLSSNPDPESISAQYNADLNQNIRVWLPEVTEGLLPAMALKNNPVENYFQTDGIPLNPNETPSRLQFNIPKEVSQTWGANQQISFIFGFLNSDGTPLRIYNSPYYNVTSDSYDITRDTPIPLYSIRLKDPSDITSLDLWSFKTRSITEQRGGVTILNNVINATTGEKTMVKVNMPSAGKLNVMVMTIDGNIITYLQHGQTEAGEHYYSWDGKNGNKGTVARGMYFIRVVGNGLDETRKVMVVK